MTPAQPPRMAAPLLTLIGISRISLRASDLWTSSFINPVFLSSLLEIRALSLRCFSCFIALLISHDELVAPGLIPGPPEWS